MSSAKTERDAVWWQACDLRVLDREGGVVICLERRADLHMAQLNATATHCILLQ